MSIGLTPDQYWNDDSSLAEAYRRADELKRERRNQELWLQGAYIYDALCRVAPVFHAFAKKGTKPLSYSSEPFVISNKQKRKQEEEQEKKVYSKGLARMQQIMADTNRKFGNIATNQ